MILIREHFWTVLKVIGGVNMSLVMFPNPLAVPKGVRTRICVTPDTTRQCHRFTVMLGYISETVSLSRYNLLKHLQDLCPSVVAEILTRVLSYGFVANCYDDTILSNYTVRKINVLLNFRGCLISK